MTRLGAFYANQALVPSGARSGMFRQAQFGVPYVQILGHRAFPLQHLHRVDRPSTQHPVVARLPPAGHVAVAALARVMLRQDHAVDGISQGLQPALDHAHPTPDFEKTPALRPFLFT